MSVKMYHMRGGHRRPHCCWIFLLVDLSYLGREIENYLAYRILLGVLHCLYACGDLSD